MKSEIENVIRALRILNFSFHEFRDKKRKLFTELILRRQYLAFVQLYWISGRHKSPQIAGSVCETMDYPMSVDSEGSLICDISRLENHLIQQQNTQQQNYSQQKTGCGVTYLYRQQHGRKIRKQRSFYRIITLQLLQAQLYNKLILKVQP